MNIYQSCMVPIKESFIQKWIKIETYRVILTFYSEDFSRNYILNQPLCSFGEIKMDGMIRFVLGSAYLSCWLSNIISFKSNRNVKIIIDYL